MNNEKRIKSVAHKRYLYRLEHNISGTAGDDWDYAKNKLDYEKMLDMVHGGRVGE